MKKEVGSGEGVRLRERLPGPHYSQAGTSSLSQEQKSELTFLILFRVAGEKGGVLRFWNAFLF